MTLGPVQAIKPRPISMPPAVISPTVMSDCTVRPATARRFGPESWISSRNNESLPVSKGQGMALPMPSEKPQMSESCVGCSVRGQEYDTIVMDSSYLFKRKSAVSRPGHTCVVLVNDPCERRGGIDNELQGLLSKLDGGCVDPGFVCVLKFYEAVIGNRTAVCCLPNLIRSQPDVLDGLLNDDGPRACCHKGQQEMRSVHD